MGTQGRLMLSIASIALFVAAMITIVILSRGGTHSKTTPTIVELTTRLPFNMSQIAAVYDGKDSIYLLAGVLEGNKDLLEPVLRFDVPSETITQTEHRIKHIWHPGPAVYNPEEGAIYFFSFTYHAFGVFQITLANTSQAGYGTARFVAKTDDHYIRFASGVWDPVRRKAYFIGQEWGQDYFAHPRPFWVFDPYAIDVKERLSSIPFPNNVCNVGLVYSRREGMLYILGGSYVHSRAIKHLDTIIQFDPDKGNGTFLNSTLPKVAISGSVGWDEERGQAIILEDNGIMTFTSSTGETELLNFTQPTSIPFVGSSGSAYVPSLRRMYVFGGSLDEEGKVKSNRIIRVPL